jgi:ABC-2 type transport system permease protein
VFYSIRSLPALWQTASHLNPFFYMIDGFRYGFFGVSDFPPLASFAVVAVSFAVIGAAGLLLLRSGYKLRQ